MALERSYQHALLYLHAGKRVNQEAHGVSREASIDLRKTGDLQYAIIFVNV